MFKLCPKCGSKVLREYFSSHREVCSSQKIVAPLIDLQRKGRVKRIKKIPPKMKIIWVEKEPLTPRKRCGELKSYV